MKIDGPKFNFNNTDNELLETNSKKSGKSGENPIGLEVKQLPNDPGKDKFQGNLDSSLASPGKPQDDLLGGNLLKLPPGLQKKISDDFPRPSNNNSQVNPNSGNSSRPIRETPTNPSDFLKSQLQNSLSNRLGNDTAINNRNFPAPINRPNANDLPLPSRGNKVKSGSFSIPRELSTSINQSIQETNKPENLFNQKDTFKDIFKADNRSEKAPNKPNPRGGKPIEQTPASTSPSQAEEIENTLEIEITQSIEVPSDRTDEFPIESDIEVGDDKGSSLDNSRIGKGKGKSLEVNIPTNSLEISENGVLTENAIELENATNSLISRLANKDLSKTIPLTQLLENLEVENLVLDELNPDGQNTFASTLELGSDKLTVSQLNLINSALDDINSLATQTSLDKTAFLDSEITTSNTNKTNISELIAASNTKTLSIAVGQSLEQVASELGIDVFDLLKANPQLLKDPLLFAGQKVRVPSEQELSNLPASNLAQGNSLASQAIENQLGKNLSQLPLEQTKTNLGNISSFPTQSELAKIASSNELNANTIVVKSDKTVQSTPQERAVEASSDKNEIKQTEQLIPGFGVFVNREIEFEIYDDQPQSKRKFNLPEPFDEWADHIYNAADKYRLDASLIASLIWCESAGKNIIGKNGHGHGLMQIDDRRYKEWLKANEGGLNPASNIDFGVSILRKNIDYFRGKLSAGIAAYDCGIDLVEESLVVGKDVDFFTTDKNYSFRILVQQDYFRRFFD